MKRDLDLIRKIMLAVEDLPTGFVIDLDKGDTEEQILDIEGYTKEQIGYHQYLIIDSGLASGADTTTLADTSPQWRIINLTSKGHDFADSARNETNWKKAITLVKSKGGGITIEVLKALLESVIKANLGLS